MSDRVINPMALWGREMSESDMWRLIRSAGELLDTVLEASEQLQDGESIAPGSDLSHEIQELSESLTTPEVKE